MGFKVSDPELAYDALLIKQDVDTLIELGKETSNLIDLLLATGIQSDLIGASLQTDEAELIAVLQKLEEASAPIAERTNTFIAELDADDAKFD